MREVALLHGPHSVSGQMQVKLPARLARELGLEAGDEFYWSRSDEDPEVLLLIPANVVDRRYVVGERLERSQQG